MQLIFNISITSMFKIKHLRKLTISKLLYQPLSYYACTLYYVFTHVPVRIVLKIYDFVHFTAHLK